MNPPKYSYKVFFYFITSHLCMLSWKNKRWSKGNSNRKIIAPTAVLHFRKDGLVIKETIL